MNASLDTRIPTLLTQRQRQTGDSSMTTYDILKECHLTKLTSRTVYNWMHILGFKYCEQKEELL